MRRPRALTRPGGVVWQSFVPDTARGQLAVFDMAETRNQENGIVVMASVDQTNDTLTMCRCHISSCRFWSQKQGWKIVLEDCKTAWISQGVWSTPYQRNPSVITKNYNAVCSTEDMSAYDSVNVFIRVQELCVESRGGLRPGLSVRMSRLMVSVDVKQYWTMLTHWSLSSLFREKRRNLGRMFACVRFSLL